ncbi:MAG: dihydroorotase, partial [Chryseobacterium sp.]|nr:dihydroorotase [Chryseobacterium sp.]
MKTISIIQPDDWHIHLRDGNALARSVSDAEKQFNRVLCMPNLSLPIKTVKEAEDYRERILSYSQSQSFTPLMTLYLTKSMTLDELRLVSEKPNILGIKYYPEGATTNSQYGVKNIKEIYQLIENLENLNIPLLLHGETRDHDIDIFDREKHFIDNTLVDIVKNFPNLRIVLEHITTKNAVDFVYATSKNIAATITPQHLLLNRNDMLSGGIKPHLYCLPVLKRKIHQIALLEAATSGNSKFFLGTDSAPHSKQNKENSCGCAGCYSAPNAIELYAQAFDSIGKIERLEGFSSFYGADFYGLSRNSHKITLRKSSQEIVQSLPYKRDERIIPLYAGQEIS